MMRCPNCGKPGHIHRSKRRSSGERLLAWVLLLRPYRCHGCNTRFWRLKFLPYRSKNHRRPNERRRHRKRRSRSS